MPGLCELEQRDKKHSLAYTTTNNVDVVSYDVKEVKSKVDALNSQMYEQQAKTKYLEKEVDKIDMKANIGIALGAAGCVLGATGIGVAGKALSFASKTVGGVVKAGGEAVNTVHQIGGESLGPIVQSHIYDTLDELPDIGQDIFFRDLVKVPIGKVMRRANAVEVDKINAINEWCNSEYNPVNAIDYDENEDDDPSKVLVTIPAAVDMCNRFRHSLKPMIKTLAEKVNEINVTDQLSEYVKSQDLQSYINKDELVREDVIDAVAKLDTENHAITIEFEDTPLNCIVVFRTYAVNKDANRQRRFYVRLVDGELIEYKGVQTNVVVEGLSIRALARSEDDRVANMPNAQLILDTTERLISISYSKDYIISGVVVEQCTCTRQMTYEVKDLAYQQDIDALSKKIDALAEITHSNDANMMSIQDTYTTVDEVNHVLTNYVQKTELNDYATTQYVKNTYPSYAYLNKNYPNNDQL